MLETIARGADRDFVVHILDFRTSTQPALATAGNRTSFFHECNFTDAMITHNIDFVSVDETYQFSKGYGLHLSVKRVKETVAEVLEDTGTALCVVMDVDIEIPPAFFNYVRGNTAPGEKAVVFNVYRAQQGNRKEHYRVDDYSTGIVGFALADCDLAGGIAIDKFLHKTVWGNEDSDFLRRLTKALTAQGGTLQRLTVDGLVHRWHGRDMDDPWYATYYAGMKKRMKKDKGDQKASTDKEN
jgi:hypothetical protein